MTTTWKKLAALLPVAIMATALQAGTVATADNSKVPSEAVAPKEESVYDKIWGLATLYKNKDNPVLQEFSLTGEFQLQWADGDSNQGSYGSRNIPATSRWDDIDVRRWRLGFKSQWFHDFKFTGIIDINPQWDPSFYKDIYQLSLTYAPSDKFNLSIGKQKTKYFSQEFSTPSSELIIFEQSLLVNTLIPKELTGAWVTGKVDNFIYALAVWGGDYATEFSRFDAGAVFQASIGYDFASALHVDKAILRLDWQNSTSGDNADGPKKFDNAFSLNTTFKDKNFEFYTDLLGATGRGTQGDVWGVTITPSYFLIDKKLQLVTRYQYAHGDNDGLNLQARYEALAPGVVPTKGAGSDYNALYVGLNYYLYGHKLKLMAGTEYNDMTGGKKDFDGWTTLIGLRLAF